MNIDGLWTLMVQPAPLVVTINDGVITGGNESYFYIGTVELKDEKLTGNVVGQHYNNAPDNTLGGLKTIHLQVEATVGDGVMRGIAKIKGIPQVRDFTGIKRA